MRLGKIVLTLESDVPLVAPCESLADSVMDHRQLKSESLEDSATDHHKLKSESPGDLVANHHHLTNGPLPPSPESLRCTPELVRPRLRKIRAAGIRTISTCSTDYWSSINTSIDFQMYIERDATLALYEFLRPGIIQHMMKRRTLGTTLLYKVAYQAMNLDADEIKMHQEKHRGRLNLLSDVWQNIVKSHLLAIQLTVFGRICTFDIVKVGSNHDGISIAKDLEKQMKRILDAGYTIGAIITDNAG